MTSVPKDSVDKKDARMELRIPEALMANLLKIQERHSISPQDVARRCLEQVSAFYEQNGYFSFPVHIVPDAEFLQRVKQTKSFMETSDAGLPGVAGTDAERESIRKSRTVPKGKPKEKSA